jgi:hypothetical protein
VYLNHVYLNPHQQSDGLEESALELSKARRNLSTNSGPSTVSPITQRSEDYCSPSVVLGENLCRNVSLCIFSTLETQEDSLPTYSTPKIKKNAHSTNDSFKNYHTGTDMPQPAYTSSVLSFASPLSSQSLSAARSDGFLSFPSLNSSCLAMPYPTPVNDSLVDQPILGSSEFPVKFSSTGSYQRSEPVFTPR